MQISNTSNVTSPVNEAPQQIITGETKSSIAEAVLNNQEQVRGSGGKMRRRRICEQSGCRKRLTLAQQHINCKCGKVFCEIHNLAEKHACPFDYKAQLEKNNKRKEVFPDRSGGVGGCGLAY